MPSWDEEQRARVAQETAAEAARTKMKELAALSEDVEDLKNSRSLARLKSETDQGLARQAQEQAMRLADLKAEAEAIVQKFGAAQGGFSEALLALSNKDTLVKIAEAMSIQRIVGGEDVAEMMSGIFKNTQLEGSLKRIMEMASANKLSQ